MWLNQLKIAIVEKNIEQLSALMDDLPKLTTPEDLDVAINLLEEATALVTELRSDLSISMLQMQKNIKFLKSTQRGITSKFDMIS
jgi:rRNA maturation endonuclease Nob1